MKLRYAVTGSTAGGSVFETAGEIEGDSPIDPAAFMAAARASFQQLTSGKAVFGRPGEGGCRGPYKVTRLVLEIPPAAVDG